MAWWIVAAIVFVVNMTRAGDELVIADFEGETFESWKAEGDAFGKGPAAGTLPNQQPVSGFLGERLASSYHGGDSSQGRLVSPPFTIERPYLNLLVGGGDHPGQTCVNLVVDGKVVRTETGTASTGADDEHLSWRSWDVLEHRGKEARIEIIDRHSGSWGHICVDQIVASDEPKAQSYANASITRAMASAQGAVARAQADPLRPGFHLMPPALWCNDPNGPIFHDGWFHFFYQHNPYGDRWEHMHWGHARSRDLVQWEHLPIALWPSKELGEDHCFSGSAAVNGDGQVMLFYTSIGKRAPEQWAAVARDRELLTWDKHSANPLLTEAAHGDQKIDEWRDPFIFKASGKDWMVVGGHPRNGKGGICLYEAAGPKLDRWQFRSVAFQGSEPNWECPNMFMIGENAVLLYSPHGPVRYHVGKLDLKRYAFESKQSGSVDACGDFYATSACQDANGRWIVWGWIRGFPAGKGWNGCISLPREISVSADKRLLQKPTVEMEKLRREKLFDQSNVPLLGSKILEGVQVDQLEIEVTLERGEARRCGLKLRRSADGKEGAAIFVDGEGLEAAGQRAVLAATDNVTLRIFLDRSVLEVFAGDDTVVTKVIRTSPDHRGIELFADGGQARATSLRIWRLSSGK